MNDTKSRGKKLLRPKQIQERLGIGATLFWKLVKDDRIRLVKLGERAVAAPEDEIDALINELITDRDTAA